MPGTDPIHSQRSTAITSLYLLVTILTLIGVALGRLPWVRMNRATIALVGATALVAMGAISLADAYASVDGDTIAVLLAMMIVNANLRIAGFFGIVADWLLHRARGQRTLLLLLMVVAGLLSALFLNDTIVLVMTPLVLEVVLVFRVNPIPYLMGLATAANIGSVGAITGNPQNILIGASSGIPFAEFSAALMPVALGGLLLGWLVICAVYRRDLQPALSAEAPPLRPRVHRPLLRKGILAVFVLVVLLLVGVPIALAALVGASLLLVTRRLRPERVFREIDWSLLVFFAGLFVVTGAIELQWGEELFGVVLPLADAGTAALTGVAAVLSNLVSNVPAVLLFLPFVNQLGDPEHVWLTLAMATTLAGNLTLLGSVANLIVAESAARRNVRLSFGEYLKAGIPVTLLTLALGVLWLSQVR